MATVGDVATAISLIAKVVKAGTAAQMMKKEFKELAGYLQLVGRQLEMLDDRELGAASVQTFRKIEEVLRQCHDLANCCRQRSTIYLMFNGKRIQNQLRGAQENITKYLTLIPLIHFTQIFRRYKEGIQETRHEYAASFQEEDTEIHETRHEYAASFQEEDTKINDYCHEHTSDESDIPERIANFTGNGFQSNARLFTYKQLVKMTHNFEIVIGIGGFGTVYYGFFDDGTEVAIKLHNQLSRQTDKEFFAELRSLTQVHHANIISLIGYCKDESYLAIVYEYMRGGSLDDYLRGFVCSPRGKAGFLIFTWAQRLQIAYQVAQGLDYLHTECNPPIIHRDVKSSNILLGSNLEAKITDFGISKAYNKNDTYETTTVLGTPGYLDPEYSQTGHVSTASDVYGFGIILLEMITGRPPFFFGQGSIVEWISRRITDEADFVDRSMEGYYDPSSMWKVLELARRCTDSSSNTRPPMAEVVIQLKEIIEMHPFKQITEDMNIEDMGNEEVEEAFVTSIAQADRPRCTHLLSAILFTSWAHNVPGRRFWRCKNWKKVNGCGYFKWHDTEQEGVMIEQMDFVSNQRDELDEEIKMMDEESAIHFSKWKALEDKIAECKRSKEALEMKSESMDRFYGRR